jgi:hypothetical protein
MQGYEELSTHLLAQALEINRGDIANLRTQATEMEATLFARINAAGGKALPCEGFTVEIKQGTPTYDMGIIIALEEHLPAAEWEAMYTPETTVIVPHKVHGGKVNKAAQYGGDVLRIIEQSRQPGAPRLVVERK